METMTRVLRFILDCIDWPMEKWLYMRNRVILQRIGGSYDHKWYHKGRW